MAYLGWGLPGGGGCRGGPAAAVTRFVGVMTYFKEVLGGGGAGASGRRGGPAAAGTRLVGVMTYFNATTLGEGADAPPPPPINPQTLMSATNTAATGVGGN